MGEVAGRLILSPSDSIYLSTENGDIPNYSLSLASIYESHRDEDGFLYLKYAAENTFG